MPASQRSPSLRSTWAVCAAGVGGHGGELAGDMGPLTGHRRCCNRGAALAEPQVPSSRKAG